MNLPILLAHLAPYRKSIVAALTIASTLLSAGLVPGAAAVVVSTVLAVAGALGVYVAPNEPTAPAGNVPPAPADAPDVGMLLG